MNRRKFLTVMGSAGVASALGTATVAQSAGTVDYPYYPDSLGVLHDTTRCIGCRRCEKACQQVNSLPMPKQSFDDLSVLNIRRRTSADAWTVVNKYPQGQGQVVFRKLQCLHCNDPACASACFAKCFEKNPDGTVSYKGDQCVGCRYCMIACPFYVPGFQYYEAFDPLVQKCTFCRPRLQKGELPGCVEKCPMDALTFGKRKDLIKIARKRIEDNPGRYVDYIYGEHDAGGTAWVTIGGVRPDALGQDTNLGNRPMGELTAGALGSVPMIIGFWPLLFAGMYGISKVKETKAREAEQKTVAKIKETVHTVMQTAVKRIEDTEGPEAAARVQQALDTAKSAVCGSCKSCKPGEGA